MSLAIVIDQLSRVQKPTHTKVSGCHLLHSLLELTRDCHSSRLSIFPMNFALLSWGPDTMLTMWYKKAQGTIWSSEQATQILEWDWTIRGLDMDPKLDIAFEVRIAYRVDCCFSRMTIYRKRTLLALWCNSNMIKAFYSSFYMGKWLLTLIS